MTDYQRLDDIWGAYYEQSGHTVTRCLVQPERPQVLEAIKTIRNEGIVEDRPGIRGRWCLSIPFADWEWLKRHPKWCELTSHDRDTRHKAWMRFMNHPDSAPFRVRDKAS